MVLSKMSACTALFCTSRTLVETRLRNKCHTFYSISFPAIFRSSFTLRLPPLLSAHSGLRLDPYKISSKSYNHVESTASLETSELLEEAHYTSSTLESLDDSSTNTVEQLLSNHDVVSKLMKMERISETDLDAVKSKRRFPYRDMFKAQGTYLRSDEILKVLDPLILEVRKERFRKVVKNRTYTVCLVVEGLSDFGNVSAALRSADALGFQAVHVVSCDSSKRYRENRHVSMGAEKWLDIELWNSPQECFEVLKSRGYRIAATHMGMNAVSIYDIDWSCPTAIVVGNENRGISSNALELSDLHCSIPMKGMVDSFNVSVAAGILMHHAVCDRTSRLGWHGDLTAGESSILLAEFSLRHSKSALCLAHEYAKQKAAMHMPKL